MNTYNLPFLLLFQFSFPFDQALQCPPSSFPNDHQIKKAETTAAANIVFKSTDDGRTWQDVSEGLPENAGDVTRRDGFFANDSGMYIRLDTEIYHNKSNSTAPFWKKEVFSDEQRGIVPGQPAILDYKHWESVFLQEINKTRVWSPVSFRLTDIRSVFETAQRSVLISYDNGVFKSTNSGKTWKQVFTGAWVMNIVESNGILMATSENGILRSTDDGEKWECVLNEGGVGIAIEPIKGGFAAITANTQMMARTVQITYDNGKTWQHIDAGLPADLGTTSIIEVGEYFFCGHPSGIFRSSDKGKTWKLLLPSMENKVFNLFVSGKVIYAVLRNGGC